MANVQLTCEVKLKGWVKPSMAALCVACRILNRMPEIEGVANWYVRNGVIFRINGKREKLL